MTSDTPRTDKNERIILGGVGGDWKVVLSDFARKLERELNTLRWIPITERLPSIEDGNGFEDVEWSDGHEIWQGNYQNSRRHRPTHWRRITLP